MDQLHPAQLKNRQAIPLDLKQHANAAVEALLPVSNLPSFKEVSELPLRVPDGDFGMGPAVPQFLQFAKYLIDRRLKSLSRRVSIDDPARCNVSAQLGETAYGRTGA